MQQAKCGTAVAEGSVGSVQGKRPISTEMRAAHRHQADPPLFVTEVLGTQPIPTTFGTNCSAVELRVVRKYQPITGDTKELFQDGRPARGTGQLGICNPMN
jgi:hypothetical protein